MDRIMATRPQVRALALAAALAFGVASPSLAQRTPAASPQSIRNFDAYIQKAMREWKVPGVAIAIVRNDSVVFTRGYGVRRIGDPAPVDPRTMFAIGSSSKAFTAAAIAMLVDEGKMQWNERVTTYLPGFEMYDPYVTRELTIRDALSHRSGLARGDVMWYGSAFDRDEILRRVRYLKPSWSFRSEFGYQNLMYLAAGQASAAVAGISWDQLIADRIFAPLGMRESNTSVKRLAGNANVATPHVTVDDSVVAVPYRDIDNIAPAGSINSNVVDMAQWVRLQLGEGKYAGKQLVTTGNMKQMHTPHTVIRLEGGWGLMFPEAHLMSYGLGWFMNDYKGKLAVHHGGNIDGMSALVAMLPEEKMGAVILTNMNGTPLPSVIVHRIFDDQLGLPPTDFSADLLAKYDALQKQGREAVAKREAQRVAGTRPSLPLEKYAGTYSDSMYGDAVVKYANGTLRIEYGPAFQGELEHWHYDTFRAAWEGPTQGKAFVTFSIDGSATVAEAQVENIAEFRRVAPKADATPAVRVAAAELRKIVGRFGAKELPFAVDVQLVGDDLKVSVPGQPAYSMVPVTPTRFRLAGAGIPEGFYMDYTMEGGRVRSVRFEQPSPQPTLTLAPVN
jgi:CubicO group peptidase (beta-lactamase class C family)